MEKLYHGTDVESAISICKHGIDVKVGAKSNDFGQGFYTTDDYAKAVAWAYRKAGTRNKKPAVVSILFDDKAALPVTEAFSDDLRWGRFIINNRNGLEYIEKMPFKDNNLDGRYQITKGRIADLQTLHIALLLYRNMQMLSSLEGILNTKYPMQTVFHSAQSLSYIKNISYQKI